MKLSVIHAAIAASACVPFVVGEDAAPQLANEYRQLAQIGIHLDGPTGQRLVNAMFQAAYAQDDNQGNILTAGITTPIQFLQTWLPGFVRTLTAARKIDQLIGIQIVGQWEDEEIVQGILEPQGSPVPYGDVSMIPLASWQTNFERRTVIRFEQGMSVGILEDARSARIRANTAAEKRAATALALDILRNRIGFFGYNGGANRTYGYLNDPNLPAYNNAPNGAGGSPLWANKTFLEITKDIRKMVQGVRVQTGDNYDPERDAAILGVATAVSEFMGVTSDFGMSVSDWLKKTYPAITVVTAPELNGANGGANVAYLYPEKINDGASDNSQVWAQLVPSKFQTLGVEKRAKGYVEDYSNALAGVMLKRPYAVYRLTGI